MTSPAPGEGAPPKHGDRLERMSLALAGVPFQAKVTVVWLAIFGVLATFFLVAQFDLAWMQDQFTFILTGLRYTLIMAVLGIILAVLLAGIGALGRISRNPIAYGVSGFYVSFFRGTPLIVQMFLIYSALPQVGINLVERFPGLGRGFSENFVLNGLVAGILALGLNYGAYMTEIFRSGIESVGGGQAEAADALGMTYRQKMQKVILPQALRVAIPPTGNEFIAMMKDTALVSFLGVALAQAELFRRASYVGTSEFKNLEALIVAAGMYWTLTGIFTFFQRRLEARLAQGYVRTAVARGPRVTGQGH